MAEGSEGVHARGVHGGRAGGDAGVGGTARIAGHDRPLSETADLGLAGVVGMVRCLLVLSTDTLSLCLLPRGGCVMSNRRWIEVMEMSGGSGRVGDCWLITEASWASRRRTGCHASLDC